MQSVSDIWSMILDRLREDLSETTIKTWFDETTVIALEGNELILHCPNAFKRSNIQDRFLPNIEAGLRDIFSSDITVRILDDDALRQRQNKEEAKPASIMDSGEFTFDTFVVGPSNQLACSAAQAVADAPGRRYNPLFIYGSSGLGKTHLLYAIAHEIRRQSPSARILYIKGDEFINDFIETVRSGRSMNEFRIKYREADLMLVDDIQFVAGKVETQNEFFHTFNTLYESKKQIVLTSDRPPQEMALLDDRLRTRFEWGLMADVQQPVLETRVAIVKNKAANLGLILDDSIANYIAGKITSNVRQLEGTVHKIKAFHDLNIPIDQSAVDRAIQDMIRSNEFTITPDNIIKEVCRYFRLEEDQIRGPSRSRDILNARQIAMYLIRRMTSLSLDETGKLFGGRDHSTTLNGVTKVENRMKTDNTFAETVKAIITNVNATK
ncbi:MAG: chromosomal replication initiator protein DnaA [Oscillospiraceae bacterium]|jgi:chromosomal replication initiator protein|nr:chromosomal replication initiator protein DnaA [Oscillospiraceae bacterium]MCI8720403.1 chromosomal replication initiator protein DnaA [Oscillospiraceae bacterium]MCI8941450.1 chromosomal replication initiator protein DnaA [Oscillospiraceae bacterium]